ncbi:hypothetical protein [Citrobacter arsenatis]|uniref:hypothetical protein n=1 Tax=Citrobacter arsenatis TaxID=2546350 RepID=UPI00300DDDB0
MKDNLIFWKKKLNKNGSKKKTFVILAIFFIFAVCLAVTGFYMKKLSEQKQAAEVERQKIIKTKESITTFYRKAFAGIDLNQLPIVLNEIENSRLPFDMIGFSETEYHCSNESCRFIYELNDFFVFSVIDKIFFNTKYEGNFTENTLNFDNVIIKSGKPRFLSKTKKGNQENTNKCSTLLNYLYGYNSVVDKSDRVKVAKLPFSSVTVAEQQFPDYNESYGLMTGEFEVHIGNSFSDAYLFSERNPYKDFFIVHSIEKSVKTGTDVLLKGVFLCKK